MALQSLVLTAKWVQTSCDRCLEECEGVISSAQGRFMAFIGPGGVMGRALGRVQRLGFGALSRIAVMLQRIPQLLWILMRGLVMVSVAYAVHVWARNILGIE